MLTAVSMGKAIYHVTSATDENKIYVVNLELKSCSCPHHQFRKAMCRHIIAAEERCAAETAVKVRSVPDEALFPLYVRYEARYEIASEVMGEIQRRQALLERETERRAVFA